MEYISLQHGLNWNELNFNNSTNLNDVSNQRDQKFQMNKINDILYIVMN